MVQITAQNFGLNDISLEADVAYRAVVGVGAAARQAVAVADVVEGVEPLLAPPGCAVLPTASDAGSLRNGFFSRFVVPTPAAAAFGSPASFVVPG